MNKNENRYEKLLFVAESGEDSGVNPAVASCLAVSTVGVVLDRLRKCSHLRRTAPLSSVSISSSVPATLARLCSMINSSGLPYLSSLYPW